MANHVASRMNRGRRSMLLVATIAAVAAPLIAGVQSPSVDGAQSLASSHDAAFEVASVRPSSLWKAEGEGSSRSKIEFGPNSLTMRNVDLNECVQWAYGVQPYRIL